MKKNLQKNLQINISPSLRCLNSLPGIVKHFHGILVLDLLVTVILSVTGCSKPPPKHTDSVILKDDVQLAADKEYVREPFNDQTRLGVIKQRTLYEMHSARIEQVRATLVEAGIDLTRVKIGDESTGGAGVNTIDALLIRENIRKSPMKESGGKILNDAGDGKSSGGNP